MRYPMRVLLLSMACSAALSAQAQAAIVPSIVRANLCPSAQSYFADQGVTLGDFVEWAQN